MTQQSAKQDDKKYRRQDDDIRGRHLVATRRIRKNELIFCERPLCANQSLGNCHRGVLVCRNCLAFCGDPVVSLKVAAGKMSRQEVVGKKQQFFPCRHNCGEIFCSEECENDFWPTHSLLCTGCIPADAENHPLIEWKTHAIMNNDVFLLVGDVISSILAYPDLKERFIDFTMVPWWDVVAQGGRTEEERELLISSCRRLCEESASLLKAVLRDKGVFIGCNNDVVTPLFIAQIIGSFEQNSIGIRCRHPLSRDILANQNNMRYEYLEEIIECLENAGFMGSDDDDDDDGSCGCQEDEDDSKNIEKIDEVQLTDDEELIQSKSGDDDDSNEENGQQDYSSDEIDNILANMSVDDCGGDDDMDILFPPLDGMAMFSTTCKMNHDCDPNVVVVYRDAKWNQPLVAHCIATCDIEEGEELCISYIQTGDRSYEERQADLADYGFLCRCKRCDSEKKEANDKNSVEPSLQDDDGIDEFDLFGSDDENNEADEDALFGEDSEDEKSKDDKPPTTGKEALEEKWDEIVNTCDLSQMGALPIPCFAEVHAFVVQEGKAVLALLMEEHDDKDELKLITDSLVDCIASMKLKKFHVCGMHGNCLSQLLYQQILNNKLQSLPFLRQAYWVSTLIAATGFAHRGHYLISQEFLDRARLLGLKYSSSLLPKFHAFIEVHASESYHGTFVARSKSTFLKSGANLLKQKAQTGLSKPIQFHIMEVNTIDQKTFEEQFVSKDIPLVIRGFAEKWPAIAKWRDISFFSKNHGHRFIPIELGSMLNADGMTEKVMNIRSFVSRYLEPSNQQIIWTLDDAVSKQSVYMAQHALMDQIPALYSDVDPLPKLLSNNMEKKPYSNVWMGTGGTRTPLHFDSYDNLLIQLVGAKYVRIYNYKTETPNLYVMKASTGKGVASQGNMSAVDCERENYDKFPLAQNAKYTEVLLLPGDCLFIPSRAWHYVRSLSTSISVNYWWS